MPVRLGCACRVSLARVGPVTVGSSGPFGSNDDGRVTIGTRAGFIPGSRYTIYTVYTWILMGLDYT